MRFRTVDGGWKRRLATSRTRQGPVSHATLLRHTVSPTRYGAYYLPCEIRIILQRAVVLAPLMGLKGAVALLEDTDHKM